MKKYYILAFVILCIAVDVHAHSIYVDAQTGSDSNVGSKQYPIKSLKKLNQLQLSPGDTILLAAGQEFHGTILIEGLLSSPDKPFFISSYSVGSADQMARINGQGKEAAILVKNASNVHISNIEIIADGGLAITNPSTKKPMRCGVLVLYNAQGDYSGIKLDNLFIHDLFYEKQGYKRGAGEVRTANGKQSYGWGIRVINNHQAAVAKGVQISNCKIENVSHTGIKLTSRRNEVYRFRDIQITGNEVLRTGGPGIQMSGVQGGLVADNDVNYSGSDNDSRKWGRGSGLWTWGSDNVLIEKNKFQNANGPGDSAGAHIDFNCSNIVLQYNLSANNAGGFCEILGNNYNCAYRYNISINDGNRTKGEHGAFQEGKIFWLSGFQGKNRERKGPFNSYFYNNTIYVKKGIVAKIAVDRATSGVLIANNIFHILDESKLVLGDQYKPENAGESIVKNITFQNNLYIAENNWPSDVLIQDSKPIFGNAGFNNPGGLKLTDYIPSNLHLIHQKGQKILPIDKDEIGLTIGLKVTTDILGNPVGEIPSLGAIEVK
jgi:hypothetical protein